jgi:hypothetical protein
MADIDDFDLIAGVLAIPLWDSVGDDKLFHSTVLNDLERGSRQDTVSNEGVNLGSTSFEQVLCGQAKCTAGVGHVINENRNLSSHGSNENHSRDFIGLLAFFVKQSKVNVETVGNGGCAACKWLLTNMSNSPLGTSGVGRNDDTVFHVDVVAHVVDHCGFGVELRVSRCILKPQNLRCSGTTKQRDKNDKKVNVSTRSTLAMSTHLSTGTSKNPWI